jgi:hypothetical protein
MKKVITKINFNKIKEKDIEFTIKEKGTYYITFQECSQFPLTLIEKESKKEL